MRKDDLSASGWDEYKRLVLHELERLDIALKDHNKLSNALDVQSREQIEQSKIILMEEINKIRISIDEKYSVMMETIEQSIIDIRNQTNENKIGIEGIKGKATGISAAIAFIITFVVIAIEYFIR